MAPPNFVQQTKLKYVSTLLCWSISPLYKVTVAVCLRGNNTKFYFIRKLLWHKDILSTQRSQRWVGVHRKSLTVRVFF